MPPANINPPYSTCPWKKGREEKKSITVNGE